MTSLVVYIFTFFSSITTVFNSGSGSISLLVNGKKNPPKIVVLEDLKPGDDREVSKDLYAQCKTPVKIYLHLKDVSSIQGDQTDPEIQEENGTPKSDLPNYIDYDLRINNTTIISQSDHILFTDAVSCWIPIGTIQPNTHVPVYQSFHFDSSVTNWAQGDKTTFTEEFLAVDASDNTVPKTGTGRIWDPNLKKCISDPNPPTPTPKPSATPKASPTPKPTPTPRK